MESNSWWFVCLFVLEGGENRITQYNPRYHGAHIAQVGLTHQLPRTPPVLSSSVLRLQVWATTEAQEKLFLCYFFSSSFQNRCWFLCVVLIGLELAFSTRLTSNSHLPAWCAGIKGTRGTAPWLFLFLWIHTHMCGCPRKPGEGIRSLGTRVMGNLELLRVSGTELAWVLWKNSKPS